MIKPTIAHRKGGALDKMWMSVEVELKEKRLIDLQLYGLLQATQKNQSYASMLNHDVLGKLEDVIASNKHESEHIDLKRKTIKSDVPEEMPLGKGPHVSFSANSPHKLILTKEMMSKYATNYTIERHGSERKFLLEQISLPFKYIEYVFDLGGEKYDDDEGIAISGSSLYTGRYQDIAGRLQDTLQQYLDASLETTKKLKFYTMQIIDNTKVGITATTGIAVTNIDGITLHSFLGLVASNDFSAKDLLKRIENSYYAIKRWTDVKILIIDECKIII
nr:14774_t:CDS:2 [Entrophospora candida]